MKSREQLIRRALQELNVLAAGQAPSAEDTQVVSNEIDPVLSDLAKRGIYPSSGSDQVEDDAFVHVAVILANSVAGSFGATSSDDVRLQAERRLRMLLAEALSYQPLQVDYF